MMRSPALFADDRRKLIGEDGWQRRLIGGRR
jgi:hypothetical protein